MDDFVDIRRKELLAEIDRFRLDNARGADERMRYVWRYMIEAPSGFTNAMQAAGYAQPMRTFTYWSKTYPEILQLHQQVGDFAAQLLDRRQYGSHSLTFESPQQMAAHQSGLLYDPNRKLPPVPGFAQFRWDYLGFPTADHHYPAVKALEDPTNLAVFIFGPTGMGKDTLAGHYCLWRAPHRTQTAFFMESEKFAQRRGRRIQEYLSNPEIYKAAPAVPGAQVPTRSMIYDWGPFAWKKGMVLPDGTEVPRPIWNQSEKYYVSMEARESEPDLWFSGVGGSTYGSRIQDAILSDLWAPDKIIGPTELESDFGWVQDTLETRLDDDGRLIVLGTMLPWQNNYTRLIESYTDGAVVIETEEFSRAHTIEKWSNGVAVVKIRALVYDADGRMKSYWPIKFPLENQIQVVHNDDTTEVQPLVEGEESVILKLREQQYSGEIKSLKMQRGLLERQRRDPVKFRAIFMQEDVSSNIGDFTDDVLTAAMDPNRSFGRWDPSETLVLGVDPAQTYGAAWVLWAVSRRHQTMALVDYGFHEQLGVAGIKDKLIIGPVAQYQPTWLSFEINRHAAVLEDQIIVDVLTDYGVKVHRHKTGGQNRPEVGMLAVMMRTGMIRFPAATKEDRNRLHLINAHFKAFDMSTLADRRSRPGQRNHNPDDIALAAWVGTVKARDILEGKGGGFSGQVSRMVPEHIARKWATYKATNRQPERVGTRAGASVSAYELATILANSYIEER